MVPDIKIIQEGQPQEAHLYGTVARIQIKPGAEAQLQEIQNKYNSTMVPGFIAQYLYKMDAEANVYYLAVVFKSKEAYFANAGSREQDARYREFRALLTDDPQWDDGEISDYWNA